MSLKETFKTRSVMKANIKTGKVSVVADGGFQLLCLNLDWTACELGVCNGNSNVTDS